MEKSHVCIATITWARDEKEEALLKRSLQALSELNLPVFITDGGSSESFVAFMKSFPQFSVLVTDKKGVYAQAKNSLLAAYAMQTRFVFYTEPDKIEFFKLALLQFILLVKASGKTGIVMASRSKKSFASFPAFQQKTETTINDCCAEVTRELLDYTYGPFLMNRSLIPYLETLTETIGWGWRPYIFIIAARLRLSVDAIEGDFDCPADQQQDDGKERIYRMKQLEQNIRGIIHAAEAVL
jgi:hypothetical protein